MLKNPWVIIGLIVVLLVGGSIWFSSAVTKQSNAGVEVKANIAGNADASVTLVEYSDPQCPACAAMQPYLKEVLAQYGDQLRFEYKHFPLPAHQFAMQASVAAEAAGQQGKFFEFMDILFEKQTEWSAVRTPNIFFIQYASDLGLDIDQFKKQMNSTVLRDRVKNERSEGNKLNVTGTPTFFLNGRKMEMDSYQSFIAQIAMAVDPTYLQNATGTTSGVNSDVRFGI